MTPAGSGPAIRSETVMMLSGLGRRCQLVARDGEECAAREAVGPPLSPADDLRQVVTERRKDHVVDRMGPHGSGRTTGAGSASPSVLHEVRILRSPLKAALRSTVHAVPESDGAFNDVPRVAPAIAERTRNEPI